MEKSKKRISQHADETAIEYMRRLVGALNYEPETILEALPTPEALMDYFDLWYKYDTEFWNGVRECIAEGEDAKPALEFCKKYKLSDFEEDVRDAMKMNVEAV